MLPTTGSEDKDADLSNPTCTLRLGGVTGKRAREPSHHSHRKGHDDVDAIPQDKRCDKDITRGGVGCDTENVNDERTGAGMTSGAASRADANLERKKSRKKRQRSQKRQREAETRKQQRQAEDKDNDDNNDASGNDDNDNEERDDNDDGTVSGVEIGTQRGAVVYGPRAFPDDIQQGEGDDDCEGDRAIAEGDSTVSQKEKTFYGPLRPPKGLHISRQPAPYVEDEMLLEAQQQDELTRPKKQHNGLRCLKCFSLLCHDDQFDYVNGELLITAQKGNCRGIIVSSGKVYCENMHICGATRGARFGLKPEVILKAHKTTFTENYLLNPEFQNSDKIRNKPLVK
eukprot:GFYU01014828.1.p1 GENE.GFYU01014828.1~~GFYU01014828.1.p1  ORF type:complete len:342 (+),score=61.25 GFYU01014828.1:69-1094(+)